MNAPFRLMPTKTLKRRIVLTADKTLTSQGKIEAYFSEFLLRGGEERAFNSLGTILTKIFKRFPSHRD